MAGLIITDPITLLNAFSGHNVIPGDTLVLRAGTYPLTFVNEIVGTAEARVTVKAYKDPQGVTERVILSGGFNDAQSSYVDYIDLEFTSDRNPLGTYDQSEAHDFAGTGNRIINCILHDSDGGGFWDNALTFYGCISYNHGVVNGGVGYGHSLYTQNGNVSHRKTIKHSVFGSSANYGLHGYATNFALSKFDATECVLLPGSTHLIGSQQADDDITMINSHVFGLVQFGYGNNDHTNLTLTGNRMYREVGPLQLHKWTSGNISSNILVSGISGGSEQDLFRYQPPVGATTLTINANAYYSRSGKEECIATDNIEPYWMNLATWRSLYGFDADSTMTVNGSSPANSSHVYSNEFAAVSKRKGLVVIWNWSQASSVSVDLTSIAINAGASMKVVNCEDPLTDIVTTTMPQNKTYSFPMTGHTVAQVAGWSARPTAFPTLGAFMVET